MRPSVVEVDVERDAQDARWGEQAHPDGITAWEQQLGRHLEKHSRAVLADHPAWSAILLEAHPLRRPVPGAPLMLCPARNRLCPPRFGHCARALLFLLAGCVPDEPIPCRAQESAEGVYLVEGGSLLGPQCDAGQVERIDLVFADEGGALFACYCDPEEGP